MDFANLDMKAAAEIGAELHVKHPVSGEPLYDKDGTPVTIRLVGKYSAAFRKASKTIAKKYIGKKDIDLDAAESNAAFMLASATVGWSNFTENGEPIPFSIEAARKLYLDHAWLRDQVDEFVGNEANFPLAAQT